MPYEVINLDTDESHGIYETLDMARGCIEYDRLQAYQIWQGPISYDDEGLAYLQGEVRVENCEPYDGDDDRARQALGA
jgi:hypothetical protein